MAGDLGTNLLIILTLVILEAVLSFDNAAILAVMSRRLPAGKTRSKALNYGLLIAYGLRIIAIFCAVLLIRNPVFLTVGGAYLLFLFLRHAWQLIRHRERLSKHRDAPVRSRLGLSPLQVVIIQIGFIDLAFAVDQVVAAVAFTKENEYQFILIIAAATIGLIFLRVLAPLLSRLMDWLPTLEHMAYVAVGFVGALLVLEDLPVPVFRDGQIYEMHHVYLHPDEAVAKTLKIGITLSLFLIPVILKLFFGYPRRRPADTQVTKALDASEMTGSPPSKKT
ncbi:MAG: hypothetical protein V4510_00055 [bacterium]